MQSAAQLINAARVLVIAHRGCKQLAPENTVAAFQMALEAGADLVELDYRHSSDGVPLVIHDATLHRTTDAPTRWGQHGVRVADKTARDIQQLDAGSWFDPRYSGLKVPLLSEALDLIQTGAATLIERKSGDAQTCVALLREKGLTDAVVVQSFDWEFVRHCHRLAPALVLGALGPPATRNDEKPTAAERTLNPSHLDEIARSGARLAVWNDDVTQQAVDEAHHRGLKVWIYTVNSAERAASLVALGVDGLISDDPAMMRKALKQEVINPSCGLYTKRRKSRCHSERSEESP